MEAAISVPVEMCIRDRRKYGKENFSVELIDFANSWAELTKKEKQYISERSGRCAGPVVDQRATSTITLIITFSFYWYTNSSLHWNRKSC